ncbi:MAG TPA: type II secretion system protein [Blastocatellia bacterium]|nr:type II secretion system protein [Blastocatellia bacterium]
MRRRIQPSKTHPEPPVCEIDACRGLWMSGSRCTGRRQRGFTLLELVMVMTIIVILAAIGVTSYHTLQQKARESVLKQDLRELRKCLDQYAADREKLPATLDDLVTAGYIHDVPADPITTEKDWVTDMGEDTISREGGEGIIDIHSNAAGSDSEGVAYKDY